MKTYIKPQLTITNIRPLSMLATSGGENETIGYGGSGSGDGNDLTRKKRGGFGSGLWSDMQ